MPLLLQTLLYIQRKKESILKSIIQRTRPLYQGRKTSKELRRAGIKVTMFVDSAALIAMEDSRGKKANLIFLGADAITKKGVINKVGSGMYAELAKLHKIPFIL